MSVRAARGEGGRGANERGLAVGGRLMPRDESSFLAALAVWRFLTALQMCALLGLSELVVYRRLRVLRWHGLVDYVRPFQREPGAFLITAAGIALLRSELPAPRVDLRTYRHDLLVGWAAIALAAEHPDFTIVSEREMRSRDRREDRPVELPVLGVPYPGLGPSGHPRLHYPDLALLDARGRRQIAVEVELTSKGRRRLEQILAAYARDRHLEQVVYLTDRDAIADAVVRAAAKAGAGGLVHVRRFGADTGRNPIATEVPANE